MRKSLLIIALLTWFSNANAQATELAQLALNIEKLAQFKSILSDLKKGYEIVSKGYNTVKDLTEGNFSIHKVFLDNLMEVSPAVKKYRKVAGIIEYQILLVREYKTAFRKMKETNLFNPDEVLYIGQVYDNLLKSSLKNLDELATVVTAGKLRMSDDERLMMIDKIFLEMEDKVVFLRHFNGQAQILAIQKYREKNDVNGMRSIYGIDK